MKVCDALVQGGHEVLLILPAEVAAVAWDDLARRYGVTHPFEMLWAPSRRTLRRFDFVWHAQMAARQFKPDLIYTWLPQSATLGAWLGYRVLLEMHADVAGRLGAWWLRQFWKAGRGQRLLVTTRALRTALEHSTRMRFPDAAVQIAPNGVDLERYTNLPEPEEARALLGLEAGVTAGFTGHFYAGRGNDLLLTLARTLPNVNFLWVGGTSEAVQEWRARLNAARCTNVRITGFVDNRELPLYQAAADTLLMPYGRSVSASSGQNIAEVINPMKMFEYMAAARAIITSDLPAIREVLDETMAVFCEAEDAAAWKSAIEELNGDRARRMGLAHNARRNAAKYTWLAREQRAVESTT